MKSTNIDEYEAPELSSLRRAALVDGVLHFAVYAATISAGILAPNIVQALDKPMANLDKTLDARKRRREIMKTVYYMKSRGYLAGEYEHGLKLTPKARYRLQKYRIANLSVEAPATWDNIWRIIIYDIPEKHRGARIVFGSTLRRAGCFQLQKSTWITPFACRDLVATISIEYKVEEFVTYFEAVYLDNAKPLIKRFEKKYPLTDFSVHSHDTHQ